MKLFDFLKKHKSSSDPVPNPEETVSHENAPEVDSIDSPAAVTQNTRRISIIIAVTVIIVTVAVIWGAWRGPAKSAQNSTDKPISFSSAFIYSSSVMRNIATQKDLSYQTTITKTSTIGSNTYQEESMQLVFLENVNTPDMKGRVAEILDIGDHSIESVELYLDGTGYFTTAGGNFKTSLTQEDYIGRYVPLLSITNTLYSGISGTENNGTIKILLQDAKEPEPWLAEEGITLTAAKGEILLTKQGSLISTAYAATYEKDGVQIELQVSTEVLDWSLPEITLPEDKEYIAISNPDTPKMLEKSIGYLTTASNIHADYNEHIYVQAFGDDRVKNIKLATTTKDNKWSADMRTVTTPSNSSKPGGLSTITTDERFIDGVYAYSVNGAEFKEVPEITQEVMMSNYRNSLIRTIPLLEHIAAFDITTDGNFCRIVITPTASYAQVLAEDAFLEMYNADHPDNLASDYVVNGIYAYITLDIKTGLPTASGFSYKGTSTQGDLTYDLIFDAEQKYTLD